MVNCFRSEPSGLQRSTAPVDLHDLLDYTPVPEPLPLSLVESSHSLLWRFSTAAMTLYGRLIRSLRAITNSTVNKETEWRRRGRELITGYNPRPGQYRGPARKAA